MLKLLLLVLVVLGVVWWLRGGSRRSGTDAASRPPPASPPDRPQQIVACAQCGLHLPAHEALPGRGGVFCGEAHRSEYERRHPPA